MNLASTMTSLSGLRGTRSGDYGAKGLDAIKEGQLESFFSSDLKLK